MNIVVALVYPIKIDQAILKYTKRQMDWRTDIAVNTINLIQDWPHTKEQALVTFRVKKINNE
jgi:hypothetical protein